MRPCNNVRRRLWKVRSSRSRSRRDEIDVHRCRCHAERLVVLVEQWHCQFVQFGSALLVFHEENCRTRRLLCDDFGNETTESVDQSASENDFLSEDEDAVVVFFQEQILDRARRNGSPLSSPFNVWIMREAQLMSELVLLIRSQLQAIKAACDLSQLGNQWPVDIAQVAHALYYQRIPEAWCDAIGPTAPLPTWGLSNFFADLTVRAEHIEKVLSKGKLSFSPPPPPHDDDKRMNERLQGERNIRRTTCRPFSTPRLCLAFTNRKWHMQSISPMITTMARCYSNAS